MTVSTERLAVILAGGKGTRLAPYTTTLPKPLVPVGEEPILGIILNQLSKSGVSEAVLAVNHMAQLIQAYFGGGQKWGLKLRYSLEDRPLSTVAPLKLISDLPDNFYVMNGDILTDLDFNALFEDHIAKEALITIATFERSNLVDYGVIETNDQGKVQSFLEKPKNKYLVSMGVYVFSKQLLDHVPAGKAFGLDDLMYLLLDSDVEINTYKHEGYWLDIGRPEDFDRANKEYQNVLGGPKN